MASVYTDRLGGPAAFVVGNGTLFTVPTGRRYIVRTMTIVNGTAAATTVNIGVGSAGTGANRVFRVVVQPDTTYVFEGRLAYRAGESMGLNTSTSTITVHATGYDFSAA